MRLWTALTLTEHYLGHTVIIGDHARRLTLPHPDRITEFAGTLGTREVIVLSRLPDRPLSYFGP